MERQECENAVRLAEKQKKKLVLAAGKKKLVLAG